jgi:hypothetical protein
MPWYVPATFVTFAFTLVAANVSAEELSVLELPRGKTVEHCGTPDIPDTSNLIVLHREGADHRDNLVNLPNGLGERVNSEIGKSYARAESELRGYNGPGIDGLQTFYPTDPSDEIFGPNPMSQMLVIDVKGGYDECFASPPSIESPEDIEAANQAGIAGLDLDDPRLEWKGVNEVRWLQGQTIQWRPEIAKWEGMQISDNAMWSSKTVGLPMPRHLAPREPVKALDVAAWNNDQVQNLP